MPEQLFDVTMFPIMFTLMFTFIFGGAIAGSPQDYLPYLAPGILVQTVVMITMYTAMTINNDIEKGVFDRIRSLPVWRPSLLVGSLLGDTLRYTMASTIIIVMTLILGYRPEGGVVGVVAAVALLLIFCFSLSWIWTLLGFKLRTPNAVMGVSMMVLFPLTFLSNVFVSPDTMPDVLESIVKVNPVTILVDASRSLMAGNPDGGGDHDGADHVGRAGRGVRSVDDEGLRQQVVTSSARAPVADLLGSRPPAVLGVSGHDAQCLLSCWSPRSMSTSRRT
ncbi:ABC transporter permease [Aeromicrobium sp. UC242_57]|uniref:ABC transporter permease n=1 Tax=Aeromicrobium sp. UC242_57 TaxID=3374624 RepID=UPI00379B2F50